MDITAELDAITQHFRADLSSAQARLDQDVPVLAAWAAKFQASKAMQALADADLPEDLDAMLATMIAGVAAHVAPQAPAPVPVPAPDPAADPNAAMA